MNNPKIAIIGAGISGLLLGKLLKKKGLELTIFEKSKGLGGRIATRRIEDHGFDHGAPYLSEHESLRSLLSEAGIKSTTTSQGLLYSGGMTKLAKFLGTELPLKKSTRVTNLRQERNMWRLRTDAHEEFAFDQVVLTAPLPQSLELLEQSQIHFEQILRNITYTKALLALVITDSELGPSPFLKDLQSIISMDARGLHPRGYVLRASAEFSEKHFDASDEEILTFFRSLYENVSHIELKRWRYATPQSTIPRSYLEVADGLFLIGDSFLYPDVRGSILSAEALAEKLN